jgi:hypothetical protein
MNPMRLLSSAYRALKRIFDRAERSLDPGEPAAQDYAAMEVAQSWLDRMKQRTELRLRVPRRPGRPSKRELRDELQAQRAAERADVPEPLRWLRSTRRTPVCGVPTAATLAASQRLPPLR